VEFEGSRIVLDMGNGSLGHLQRYTDIYAVDAVILSHLHVDHFIDLCSYYVALKYRPDRPGGRVPVWGPAETHERLVSAYGLTGGASMSGEFDVHTLAPEFAVGPFTVTTARMQHPVDAFAIRVTAGGRSLTYSGDTGPTPRLAELASGTDLALFEASFVADADNPADLHLTGGQAADLADQAAADRILLTHLVPWNDTERVRAEAAAIRSDVELARPGLTIDLS
jgi:ribonuclease BN (tRNA processing enzyme)